VNLIHGALYPHGAPTRLIGSLLDDLGHGRIEVDMIKFSGPRFAGLDNRLMSLQLVEQWLTEAALFTASGETVVPSEVLYKKPVLVVRGSFRPMTMPMLDMLEQARKQFSKDAAVHNEPPVEIFEMTLRQLQVGDKIDHRDFLDRADTLSALGRPVLISNFLRYHRLVTYLSRYTQKPVCLPLGVNRLKDVINEKFYTDMPGGLMESLGQLFKNGAKLYVYPALGRDGRLTTIHNMEVAPNLRHLFAHLVENRLVENILEYDPSGLPAYAGDALKKIQTGDCTWEKLVPLPIAEVIKAKQLFGLRCDG